jgi:DNA-directed RNA polymerase subunit RPC12/RpoP
MSDHQDEAELARRARELYGSGRFLNLGAEELTLILRHHPVMEVRNAARDRLDAYDPALREAQPINTGSHHTSQPTPTPSASRPEYLEGEVRDHAEEALRELLALGVDFEGISEENLYGELVRLKEEHPDREVKKWALVLITCLAAAVTPRAEANVQPTREAQVHCPRCGATAITTGQKGWTLLTGPLFSGTVVLVCMACGKRFRPGAGPVY